MNVVGIRKLREFQMKHGDAKEQLAAWLSEVQDSEWRTPSDVKQRYRHASFLSENNVVFNVKGNKFRIHVQISYGNQVVLIKRIGTHAEYSRWEF
jgi:mRNA interferase HigB